MPRRRRNFGGASSAFEQIRRQARSLLSNLRMEIRNKENELKRLKEEEARLGGLTGRPAGAGGGGGGAVGRGRINWRAVLSQVPKQFKAADIREVRGLRDKRPSEIFAAITRWIDAGLVKRKARGQYLRS
jgi:hypothetical protein